MNLRLPKADAFESYQLSLYNLFIINGLAFGMSCALLVWTNNL